MQIKDNTADSSSLAVNGATEETTEIETRRPVERPKLRRRDDSDIQRIEDKRRGQESSAIGFIEENRAVRGNIEALLQSEARQTAQTIADAPYRLQELIVDYTEEAQTQYGNYSDLRAQNQKIRDLWK